MTLVIQYLRTCLVSVFILVCLQEDKASQANREDKKRETFLIWKLGVIPTATTQLPYKVIHIGYIYSMKVVA